MLIAFFWGEPIFRSNIDANRIIAAEQFIKNLDNKIQNIIRIGGEDAIDFNLYGSFELIDNGYNDVIEIRMPVSIDLPEKWVYLRNSTSVIREIKRGDTLIIQLFYPTDNFVFDLFSDGNRITTGGKIIIKKNSTKEEYFNNKRVIVIQVKFVIS